MSDERPLGRTGLYVLGAVLLVQWGFLFLVQVREVGESSTLPIVALALSVAAAVLFRVDARRVWESDAHWWEPKYRWWALGGLPFGINVGIALAYAIRRQEARTEPRSTDRWKVISVLGAVTTAVGTTAIRVGADALPVSAVAAISLLSLNALGLTAIAIFYDVRHVTEIISERSDGWLHRGYHWIVLVALLIPANLLFTLLYLFRRRRVVGAAEVVPPGEREPDGTAVDHGEPDEEPTWRE